MMKKNIAFIVNPVSGKSKKTNLSGKIIRFLDKNQFDECRIVETEEKGHATDLANNFVKEGFDIIVAVGGDGTVNEVASALINTPAAFGIIPCGSGNGLARHLKIPLNLYEAVNQFNYAEIEKIDYGVVNEQKTFFCTCGTGFDAYISELFSNGDKRGFFGYIENTIKGYFKYVPQYYQLTGDSFHWEGKAFIITFANASQWGNNAYIAPKASIQDGLMDVSVISKLPIKSTPRLAYKLFSKKIDNDLLVTTFRSNEITLIRDNADAFHLDGDPYEMGKEIHIKMIPEGLNMIVKKRF